MIRHVFFDIGGVLGTNGWDREQRAGARDAFGLEPEVEERHQEVSGELETGRMSLTEYLECTVFFQERAFTRDAFRDWMLAQSAPDDEVISLVRRMREHDRVELMTMNNESEDLNLHRIAHFGLRPLFDAFLSSCWLGVRKPALAFFDRALGIAQAEPAASLFIDDRPQNLSPARRRGLDTIHFTGAPALEAALRERGLLS